MKFHKTPDQPELSRPIAVDKISPGGFVEKLRAGEEERRRLAGRFALIELPKLEADLTVKPTRGGRIFEVEGTMRADVVQRCVVTLERLPAHIGQEIKVLYAGPELLEAGDAPSQAPLDMEAEETEPIVDGIIDLGELVAQTLGIALDPYPRKKGVAYVKAQFGSEEESVNPFAKLSSLTRKGKDKE